MALIQERDREDGGATDDELKKPVIREEAALVAEPTAAAAAVVEACHRPGARHAVRRGAGAVRASSAAPRARMTTTT